MPTKAIPEGYHSITPYLVVDGAERLIDFLKKAVGAKERFMMKCSEGKIAHAELQIGDSIVMLADSSPQWQPTTAMIHVYVEDIDQTYQRAVAAGGKPVKEPANQFYGDRSGSVRDAFGNQWHFATHVEDVTPEEMERRAKEWLDKQV